MNNIRHRLHLNKESWTVKKTPTRCTSVKCPAGGARVALCPARCFCLSRAKKQVWRCLVFSDRVYSTIKSLLLRVAGPASVKLSLRSCWSWVSDAGFRVGGTCADRVEWTAEWQQEWTSTHRGRHGCLSGQRRPWLCKQRGDTVCR